ALDGFGHQAGGSLTYGAAFADERGGGHALTIELQEEGELVAAAGVEALLGDMGVDHRRMVPRVARVLDYRALVQLVQDPHQAVATKWSRTSDRASTRESISPVRL